jgi:hypothetical protein
MNDYCTDSFILFNELCDGIIYKFEHDCNYVLS